MLTLDNLKAMEPHSIFAYGARLVYTEDSMFHWQKWVAVRGGIEDWAIYEVNPWEDPDKWDWNRIKEMGDKVHSRYTIEELVPSASDAMEMYRD